MSLREYQKKRLFHKTPEPSGMAKKTGKSQIFVIQKHAASHLHYDLRLEMHGILKSWAVPKGPSLNPKDKRLAIQVEDHPYAYKDFEGTIPQGNYGAGEVIIWDEGEYELIPPGSLAKGNFKFILHGQKLKGAFSLIKMQNTENNWLLIKLADNYATSKNILKNTQSVRSAMSISDKKTAMPTSIQPMLAKLSAQAFNRQGWLFEIKWDGYRMIAYLQNHRVRLQSRNLQDYTKIYQPITTELATLSINAVLDGEMVVTDAKGRSIFQLLQQYEKTGKGDLQYYVFDILWLNGQDLTSLPLIQRKKILKQNLPALNHVHISEYIEDTGKEFFQAALKQKLEGIMAKDGASRYLPGQRSPHWLKIKTVKRQKMIICGYTLPRGSRSHLGALILGIYRQGHLEYSGHVGTGLNETDLALLRQHLDKLKQSHCPFSTSPHTNMPAIWVKPKLIAEISFTEWTQDGRLRHPVFMGLRQDKFTKEVQQEQPIMDEQTLTINHHRLKLTHLSKIYWPDEGITKGEMIDYYRYITEIMLPYLKNRPQSLNRHPDGIAGKSFFQKNLQNSPSWIKTKIVHSAHEKKDINYLIIQNEASLIYLAQLGCIEINPWLSRVSSLDYPDYCVLDLDPEVIDFESVVKAALKIHRLLEKIAVENFCKTSGATGLHIYIPLGAHYTYEQSAQFAELIATVVHNQLPEITSIARLPAKRQGKVYLDYLQNRRGQTVAAPYSLRPRPQAPISTPLHWREVTKRLKPHQFNIKTIPRRINKWGDVWLSLQQHQGIDLNDALNKLHNLLG